MSIAKKWAEVETMDDLREFVKENMQGCTVAELGDEVVIRTGAVQDLAGYLYEIEDKSDD